MRREYLRVTQTSARLDPDVITTSLASLLKLARRNSIGPVARFKPFRSEDPITFEFVAISEGEGKPVEFYYGSEERLNVLDQRLRAIYPASFDIDHVEIDPVEKLIQAVERPEDLKDSDGGLNRVRPSLTDVSPRGVRWRGRVDRRKDWMPTLTAFSEAIGNKPNHPDEDTPQSGRAPLAPVIDQLTKAA